MTTKTYGTEFLLAPGDPQYKVTRKPLKAIFEKSKPRTPSIARIYYQCLKEVILA